MNILFLTTHLNIGGISSYCLTLGKGLLERGQRVYIASSGGELTEQFRQTGINHIPIPIKTKVEIHPKIFLSAFKLAKIIKNENIELMHAQTRVTQVLGCLLQGYTQRPFISTCHGFFKKRPWRRIFPCWGAKVIAISEPVKEHLMLDFGISEDKIRVIHNGIDLERFLRPTAIDLRPLRLKFGLNDGPVVGIVARLSDVKGHTYLIRAMKTVLEHLPEAQLLIIGNGKMEQGLKNLTKELLMQKCVKFIPSLQDTRDVLCAMDLFVLPSLKEGLGLSLIEAMAQGIAVIGSNVGGIKSLIQDGLSGILVMPEDVKGLSEAILALLKDPVKREYLGKNARDYIRQNFSAEKMVRKTEEVYEECLNKKGS